MTAAKQKLTAPAVGETVKVKGAGEYTVQEAGSCQHPNNGRWYCITHKEHFLNQFQKDSHIHSGTHKLVWICFEHGLEVDPKWFD